MVDIIITSPNPKDSGLAKNSHVLVKLLCTINTSTDQNNMSRLPWCFQEWDQHQLMFLEW